MGWEFKNDKPIYLQVVEQLKKAILSGDYKSGEKLPSVRDLGLSIGINPNTVMNALLILEQEGFIFTERNTGKFVSLDLESINANKTSIVIEKTKEYIKYMKELDYSNDDIEKFIKKELI